MIDFKSLAILICNILLYFSPISNGHFALENGQTSLNCSCDSQIFWQRKTSGDFEDIYIHEEVMTLFQKRFNVTKAYDSTTLVLYKMIIKDVEMNDAGLYRCTSDNGMGEVVVEHELVVLAPNITCNSSSTVAVGINSCGFRPTPVDLMCFVVYRGVTQPTFTWIDVTTGITTSYPTKTHSLDRPSSQGYKTIYSILTFEPEMRSPNLRCSVENLLGCATEPVDIHYAIKGDLNLYETRNSSEYLDCSANSSVTCSYTWRLGQKVITFLQNPLVETLASSLDGQSDATFKCSAVCHLRSQSCDIEVMSAKIKHTSENGVSIIIMAAVLGISAFLVSALLFLFILRRYIINQGLCPIKKAKIISESVPLNAVCYEGEELDEIEEISLPEYIIRCSEKYSNRPAFIDPILEKIIYYKDIDRLINNVARGLHHFKVRKETRVGVVLPNCIQYPVVFHAILRVGAVCVPVLYTLTQDDLKFCLTDSNVDLVITTSESKERCKSLLQYLVFRIILIDKIDLHDSSLDDFFDLDNNNVDDKGSYRVDIPDLKRPLEVNATISYSSGTTGQPKGCLHTHGSYMANLKQMCHPSVAMYRPGQDATLAMVSMSHMYGQDLYFLAGMASGCTMIVMRAFSVSNYLDLAVKYKITCAHLVPSHLLQILRSNLLEDYDLSPLRRVETKAAHLNDEVMASFENKLPNCRLLKGYGMTEAMCVTKERMCQDGSNFSVGTLLPGVQAKVMGIESKVIVGERVVGELFFFSPALFKGYWQRSMNSFDEAGFFKSEDIGYFDESGRLYILDRVNDQIKCNEELVFPSDIENVIIIHPKVEDVGVVGVQVPDFGEAPRAFVVKKEKDLTEDEIYNHVIDRVAPHKRLMGGVFFIESIPRLPSGKICRAKLKAKAM